MQYLGTYRQGQPRSAIKSTWNFVREQVRPRHAKMRGVRFILLTLSWALFVVAIPGLAQDLNGTLRGLILDQQGRAVANANVTATNESTNLARTVQSSNAGVYVFANLAVGSYTLTAAVGGFAPYNRMGVLLRAAQVTDVTLNLSLAPAAAQVRVEAGANVVQTESSQLSGTFEGNAISDIPVTTGANLSVLNLAIYLPNTTAAMGGTSGTGGSIGGLRGRQNSFTIDGIDDNDPNTTTVSQQVIPDAVREFTVNQNIFSAEFGRGSGGQFNVITKTGSGQLHFGAWFYNGNRNYDASDNQEQADIRAGVRNGKRRYDFNRAGGDIGGPVLRNRLFLYGAYEFQSLDQQVSASAVAPTAAGLSALNALAADSQVRSLLAQFPVAPAATSTVTVNGQQIPVGPVNSAAPSFTKAHNFIVNGDLDLNPHQRLHVGFLQTWVHAPVLGAFPQAQFESLSSVDDSRVILDHVWTASPGFVNDFKASYSRFSQFFPLSGTAQNYPNLFFPDLGGILFGPNSSLPEYRVYNEYLLGDTVTWISGRHTLKWGGQYYWYVAPSVFLQDQRGQYGYTSLAQLINDQVPSLPGFSLQGVGNGFFSDNSRNFALFLQDDLKIGRHLIVNLGLRYDFFGNPAGTKLNALNAVASVPGTPLVFHVPTQDRNNFGPRVGFAWDPTGSGKWAVRGGAAVVYDLIPWNFYSNGLPAEVQAILTPSLACANALGVPPPWCATGNGFLASGAMNLAFVPPASAAIARALTTQTMSDAKDPKVFSWTLGVQREIFRNTSLELRYLGTRGLELPVQFQLNSITAFEQGARSLPTYIHAGDIPAIVPAGAPTLAQFLSLRGLRYAAQGFTGGFITEEAPIATSTYNAGDIELLHRFGHGLFLRANYTYSNTMDDATNDLATSAVNPRRPENPYNLRNEWARSALDVPNKVAIAFLYDTPALHAANRIVRGALNGWQWSGSFLYQTGQPVTIQSGVDSNGNGDTAGDRVVLNPAGTEGVGSLVTAVCRNVATGATSVSSACAPANTVGYVANNSSAKYIQAASGTISNLGRNTYRSPPLNVWNMALAKNNKLTERFNLQVRIEAFNVFNHPDFTLANLSVFPSTANALNQAYTSLTSVSVGTFLNPQIFNGGGRRIELGLKLSY
jgi:outer membrane receptor protein involved in Fe transport